MAKAGLSATVLLIAVSCLGGYLTRQTWLRAAAESLVCENGEIQSDVIFIDHVEDNYLLFKRAQQLQSRGLAPSVLVPILNSVRNDESNLVALGFVEVMCRIARVLNCITFNVPLSEPISLNLARRSAEELQVRSARSILLITSGFRSRRAYMVYSEMLRPFGITVHCQPVFGNRTPSNWFNSAHGIQDVCLQFVKFWYYRLAVM